MGATSIKNEVKTLFLIVNTINMIAAGLFPFSVCIWLLINIQYEFQYTRIIIGLVVTVVMLCITTFGSYGAVFERRIMIDAYTVLTGLTAVVEVAATLSIPNAFGRESYLNLIFHPCVMLLSMVLAVLLNKQICRKWSPSPSAPMATVL